MLRKEKVLLTLWSVAVLFCSYWVVSQEINSAAVLPVALHGKNNNTKIDAGKERGGSNSCGRENCSDKAGDKKREHLLNVTSAQRKELEMIQSKTWIFCGPKYKKEIALTFDDGPDTVITPKILDVLREYDVRATFFVVGKMIKGNPDLLTRIYYEGHTIGNHSYRHPCFTKCLRNRMKSEINDTNNEIFRIIGKKPTLFRAPYGAVNEKVKNVVGSEGYKIIQWNIDTNDWRGRSKEQIFSTVKNQVTPGSIVLQHSVGNVESTVRALPMIIEELKDQGYEFVTIDELLRLPAYQ